MEEGFSTKLFQKLPVIGIIRGLEENRILHLVHLYYEEGFTTVEITMNTEGAERIIRQLKERYGSLLNVGAGTVRIVPELDQALKAGATFIVTPIINEGVIKACVAQRIPVFPGAYTPTEVYKAWSLGATAVKIFPAESGGLAYLKALKGPLDMVRMIPTGGVNLDNLKDFLALGVYGVGMGSQLFPRQIVEREDWPALRAHFRSIKRVFEE